MMNGLRRILVVVSILSFSISTAGVEPAWAAKKKPQAQEAESGPACKASLLMDVASGEILEERNIHESLPPASMVKIMLTYVVLKKVKDGMVKLDEMVTISPASSKIGGSQVFLKQGEQFTLGQLLEAVMIQSANDAAMAIAEHIGGTKEGFVELMNIEAKAIGMKESEFHTPHGLPPGKDQLPDLVSAHDFALLSRTLIKNYPDVLQLTSRTESGFRDGEFKMTNHNHLLRTYAGCDGLKTGYYNEAGFCVTATAQRNNHRLLTVVMGCKERKARDAEAARLLSKGFAQYKQYNVIGKGTPIEQPVRVAGGNPSTVVPVTASELTTVIKPGEEAKITRQVHACSELQAPVSANTPCGNIVYSLGDRTLGTVDLIVPNEIQEGGFVSKIRGKIGW